MKVEITFTEPVLGTCPGNKEIAEEFIISRHPDGHSEEESDSITETIEKATTVFARDNGVPILWDYQIKGTLKEACMAMIMTDSFTKEALKKVRLTEYQYKRSIDKLVFVNPRKIPLVMPEGGTIIMNERPLRKESFKGGTVALVRSEQIPAGTKCIIEIKTLNPKLDEYVKRWLDYGALSGIGQWRNASWGRYSWTELIG